LYNEIKAKKYIKKTLQNKYTKFKLGISLKNSPKKWSKIAEIIFLKKLLLFKKKEGLDFSNNFFLVDLFFYQNSHKYIKKQVIKYNLMNNGHAFTIETKIKSNQFKNFSNKVKRIYSSLVNA